MKCNPYRAGFELVSPCPLHHGYRSLTLMPFSTLSRNKVDNFISIKKYYDCSFIFFMVHHPSLWWYITFVLQFSIVGYWINNDIARDNNSTVISTLRRKSPSSSSSSCRAASTDISDPLSATSPYRSSPLVSLQGYIPYPHIAAVWGVRPLFAAYSKMATTTFGSPPPDHQLTLIRVFYPVTTAFRRFHLSSLQLIRTRCWFAADTFLFLTWASLIVLTSPLGKNDKVRHVVTRMVYHSLYYCDSNSRKREELFLNRWKNF